MLKLTIIYILIQNFCKILQKSKLKIFFKNILSQLRSRSNQLAMDVVVFVVGGGNYVEYQNLIEYAKSKGLQRITYGCTEMINPKQFMEQVIF